MEIGAISRLALQKLVSIEQGNNGYSNEITARNARNRELYERTGAIAVQFVAFGAGEGECEGLLVAIPLGELNCGALRKRTGGR